MIIMPYSTVLDDSTTTSLSGGVAAVECHKQVRSWRLLRSLLRLLIRGCSRRLVEVEENDFQHKKSAHYYGRICYTRRPSFYSDATVTGTIFGSRNGNVCFCIQKNQKSANPILLLELAVPTKTLAREMKGGFLRIVLKCGIIDGSSSCSTSLLSMPVWTMLCNGRRAAGFAVKRSPSKVDMEILQQMKSVVVGAGTVSAKQLKNTDDDDDDDIMYLRGEFQRVRQCSSDSESFHLIDPDCSVGQELSFFFLRS